jgi:translation initiation factor RLI1
MVLLDIKLTNFLLFNDFSMNLSYPKKPVNSSIEKEHLVDRPNFRYKKLIVLMGANASGKTALGKVLMGAFNFISKKEYAKTVLGYQQTIISEIESVAAETEKAKSDYEKSKASLEGYKQV